MTQFDNRYSFTMNQDDGTIITLSGNKVTLDDVIDHFKAWLKGCEYSSILVEQICRDLEM